ncbi:integrase arm-type DNA-binding domain-containing protein [Vibrio cyclitrophicus]
MPKKTTSLSDKQIKAAEIKTKEYILSDGNGLNLRIRPNGTKSWQYRYTNRVTGKVKKLSLGSYPTLKLADARKIAQDHRNQLANGVDPREHIELLKQDTLRRESNTFICVAEQWFKRKKKTISNDHAERVWRTLQIYIFPKFQNVPIESITRRDAIQLLRPLEEAQKLSTIKRICQSLNQIMEYAVDSDVIDVNPLTRMINAFEHHNVKHMPTIRPEILRDFLYKLNENNTLQDKTKYVILWQLHTMLRPKEAARTRWSYIDIHKRCLTMPPEEMKGQRAHKVPLTDEMIEILNKIRPLSEGKEFVFPGERNSNTHIGESTANAAIKRSLGYKGKLVAHGLRSIASTALHEQEFDSLHIEACLSHADKNTTRASYNRTDFFEQRKNIMAWWSEFIKSSSS